MVEPLQFLVDPGEEVGQYVITARTPTVTLGRTVWAHISFARLLTWCQETLEDNSAQVCVRQAGRRCIVSTATLLATEKSLQDVMDDLIPVQPAGDAQTQAASARRSVKKRPAALKRPAAAGTTPSRRPTLPRY